MADCPCLPKCPFFNDQMASRPSTAEMMKRRYCKGDYSNCARWMVFQAVGKESIPSDLFPNQVDRVKTLIQNK